MKQIVHVHTYKYIANEFNEPDNTLYSIEFSHSAQEQKNEWKTKKKQKRKISFKQEQMKTSNIISL